VPRDFRSAGQALTFFRAWRRSLETDRALQRGLLLVILLAGAALRLAAFVWNDLPHGDVFLDEAAAWSLRNQGRLAIPFVAPRPYPSAHFGFGYPLDQHAPLWPVMGALGALLVGEGFLALKLFTLVFGTALIPAAYSAFCRPFGAGPALCASAGVAFTYVLVDYAGNGSLYILQALLFLLFIRLAAEPARRLNALLLGVLTGLAYLLNYQAVVLFGALAGLYLVQTDWRRLFARPEPQLWIALAAALAVVTPWLIRNTLVFGSPFYSTNLGFVLSELDVPAHISQSGDSLIIRPVWIGYDFTALPARVAGWVLRNLGYFAVRILILAPFVSAFLLPGSIHLLRQARGSKWSAALAEPLLLLPALYLASACLWPVFQFRYFVPVLPLVSGLGFYGLSQTVRAPRFRRCAFALCFVALLVVDVVTFLRVPSHTNYYDSNEFYHWRTGEVDWQADARLLQQAAQDLSGRAPGAVIADAPVFYFTRRPLVRAVNVQEAAQLRFLAARYAVRYILDVSGRENLYLESLGGTVVFRNSRYSLIELE
jgi:4-amino-4-deoxy-L-arabinose transferase-like glycosyltransferase